MLTKVEWKSTTMVSGVQCVIGTGVKLRQKWYVDNWDCRTPGYTLLEAQCLAKELGKYGWDIYIVLDQKIIWLNAYDLTTLGKFTAVIMETMLVLSVRMVRNHLNSVHQRYKFNLSWRLIVTLHKSFVSGTKCSISGWNFTAVYRLLPASIVWLAN